MLEEAMVIKEKPRIEKLTHKMPFSSRIMIPSIHPSSLPIGSMTIKS